MRFHKHTLHLPCSLVPQTWLWKNILIAGVHEQPVLLVIRGTGGISSGSAVHACMPSLQLYKFVPIIAIQPIQLCGISSSKGLYQGNCVSGGPSVISICNSSELKSQKLLFTIQQRSGNNIIIQPSTHYCCILIATVAQACSGSNPLMINPCQ